MRRNGLIIVCVWNPGGRFQCKKDRRTPESPHAAGKLSGEHYCRLYRKLHDLDTICLGHFNSYGPRQRNDSPYSGVVAIFIDRPCDGKPLSIHGDGDQTRDFVFVEDVVRANLSAATVDLPATAAFNIGTGTETSIAELADAVESVADRPLDRKFEPRREADVGRSGAGVPNASESLGFISNISLDEVVFR